MSEALEQIPEAAVQKHKYLGIQPDLLPISPAKVATEQWTPAVLAIFCSRGHAIAEKVPTVPFTSLHAKIDREMDE